VARTHAIEPTLLDAVLNVNKRQIVVALQMIERLAGDVDGKTVAVIGVAFKDGTDDLRDSPALTLIDALTTRGAHVRVFDAYAWTKLKERFRNGTKAAATPYEAARGAHAVIVSNDDPAHANLDWQRIAGLLAEPNVVDLRNSVERKAVEAAGLRYAGVGRRSAYMVTV